MAKTLQTYLTANTLGFQAGFAKAERTLSRFHRQFDRANHRIGRQIGKMERFGAHVATGVLAAGAAATASGGVAVKRYGEFSEGLANVNTLARMGKRELDSFADGVRSLSVELGQSKPELFDAIYQALSAEIPKEQVLEFTKLATQLAKIGQGSPADAVETMVRLRNAFPQASDTQIADAAFKTVEVGILKMSDLGMHLGKVSGTASEMGLSMQELMGSISTASKSLRPEQAFTAVNAVMMQMLKPSADLQKTFDALGVTGARELIALRGWPGALDAIGQAGKSLGLDFTTLFPSVEAMRGLFAITGQNAKTLTDHITAQASAVGAVANGWEAWRQENESFTLAQVREQLDNIVLVIGQQLLPYAQLLAESLSGMLNTDLIDTIMLTWNDFGANLVKTGVVAKTLLGAMFEPFIGVFEMALAGITTILDSIKGTYNLVVKTASAISGGRIEIPELKTDFAGDWERAKSGFGKVGGFFTGEMAFRRAGEMSEGIADAEDVRARFESEVAARMQKRSAMPTVPNTPASVPLPTKAIDETARNTAEMADGIRALVGMQPRMAEVFF